MLPIFLTIENDNDRHFVERLYEKYEKQLYKVALKSLNNKSNAEDCVHDVFCAIINHLERFKAFDSDHQIKYMCVCCRNAAINKYNKKENYASLTVEDEDGERVEMDVEDFLSDVDKLVINREAKDKVRRVVNSLDAKYRDVVVLKYEYDFSNSNISAVLYISEELVRQRLKRAKALLRKNGELNELFE